MTDKDFGTTLAYTKSPKVSRRTTFQDELEAAVFSRGKKKPVQYSYSDDFDDDGDEDDVLKELLSSRKKRIDAFKAGKSKTRTNDFTFSDDEGENERPKKVSFLKTRKVNSSPLRDVSPESQSNVKTDSSVGDSNRQTLTSASPSFKSSEQHDGESAASDKHDWDSPLSSILRKSPTGSTLCRASEDSQWDSPQPLPSDGGAVEASLPLFTESSGERKESVDEGQKSPFSQSFAGGVLHTSPTDSLPENEPPRPKPRQRTFKVRSPRSDEQVAEPGSPHSRPPTSSSVSIPLSSSTTTLSSGKRSTTTSHSPQGSQGDHSISSKPTKSSSSSVKSQQSQALSKSTDGSRSRDGHISEDSKDHGGKYSSSFEEFQDDPDPPEPSVSRLSHVSEKSADTRPSSCQTKGSSKSRSACSYRAESKYLGTLKVLDSKVSLTEAPPEAADTLRAAIYQEWLKKKQETLHETLRLKKREERLKADKRKKDEETKIQDAKASYEAWKEKKSEVIRAQIKEKEDVVRKKQREIDEQEEKKQSAKKVFEKWKQEHDEVLKEKYRKRKEAENKLQRKKEEEERARRNDCKSAFSDWDEKKKDVVSEKVKTERREKMIKEEEEKYEKEEKDRMALEMYEKWLLRKERQQRRQRKDMQIKAILQDEPPPPWSPPNKTVPFGK